MAEELTAKGVTLTSGGTDNHLMVLDVTNFGLTGRQAEDAVRSAGITLNRNSVPFDPNGAWYTSGLRIGTPALTSLGMGVEEMKEIADIVYQILSTTEANTIASGKNAGKKSLAKMTTNDEVIASCRTRIAALLERFPLYPELDAEILKKVLN